MRATWGGGDGPHRFFTWVKERAAIVAGLADSTMTRDDAWRFLVLGRSLERVDMTARLLWACFGDPSGSPDWVTTLRSCSAPEAFSAPTGGVARRRVPSPRPPVPRSVLSALGQAERCLAELDPRAGRAGMDDEGAHHSGAAGDRGVG